MRDTAPVRSDSLRRQACGRLSVRYGVVAIAALSVVLSACLGVGVQSPGATPATANPTSAPAGSTISDAEWSRVLAEGKREGKVSVVTHPSMLYSGWVKTFEDAFPDITVEHLAMRPSDVTPRILAEQKNDQYLYDVMVAPLANSIVSLSPAGAFEDIRPFFVRPDAVDSSKWPGGLEIYADEKDPFNLVTSITINRTTLINRRLLSKEQLSSIDDLIKPELKGRIAIYDPTAPTAGSFALASFIKARGETFARQVLDNAVIIESAPDTTNFVASGRYAVGLGVDLQAYVKLKSEGRADDLEIAPLADYAAAAGIAVLKKPPHPNAARVVLNWFLSQEGQEAYARDGQTNSRRAGVPSFLAADVGYSEPDWNNLDKVLRPTEWVGQDLVNQATRLAKEAQH